MIHVVPQWRHEGLEERKILFKLNFGEKIHNYSSLSNKKKEVYFATIWRALSLNANKKLENTILTFVAHSLRSLQTEKYLSSLYIVFTDREKHMKIKTDYTFFLIFMNLGIYLGKYYIFEYQKSSTLNYTLEPSCFKKHQKSQNQETAYQIYPKLLNELFTFI